MMNPGVSKSVMLLMVLGVLVSVGAESMADSVKEPGHQHKEQGNTGCQYALAGAGTQAQKSGIRIRRGATIGRWEPMDDETTRSIGRGTSVGDYRLGRGSSIGNFAAQEEAVARRNVVNCMEDKGRTVQ